MTFDISSYALTMAHYNQWMNGKLYTFCATLGDEQRRADSGLFFVSIYGTLNHLLVCDLMWLARFTHTPVPVRSLSQELFENFEQMMDARREVDRAILAWTQSLAASSLSKRLSYRSLAQNTERDVDFAQAIVHFFNHQTHHRGQITAVLSQLGINVGVTDLIFMPGQL